MNDSPEQESRKAVINCRHCGKKLAVLAASLDKKVRCPTCRGVFTPQPYPSSTAEEGIVSKPPAPKPVSTAAAAEESKPPKANALGVGRSRASKRGTFPLWIFLCIGVVALLAAMGGATSLVLYSRFAGRVADGPVAVADDPGAADEFKLIDANKRFRIIFPAKPEEQRQPIPGQNNLFMTIHVLDRKNTAYFLGVLDIPEQEMQTKPLEQRFQGAQQGMLRNAGDGKLVSEKAITFEEWPGREIVIDVPGKGQMVSRLIAVENRFYILLVGGDKIRPDAPAVARFFESFQLSKAPVATAFCFPDLLGYWSFDEKEGDKAVDGSGEDNHATIHKAERVPGVLGGGLKLNGDGYVAVDSTNLINFTEYKRQFTIMGWFKTETPKGALISMRDGQGGITLDLHPGGLRGGTFTADGQPFTLEGKAKQGRLHDQRWHHFALVGGNHGRLQLYIDGASAASSDRWPDNIPTSDHKIGVGFVGLLDEIALFCRALDDKEIKALAGRDHAFVERPLARPIVAAPTSFHGLLGYWSFDEKEGDRALDSSGAKNHATIHGAQRVAGRRGQALKFDGKSYLALRRVERFNFDDKGLTLAGWFRTTNADQGRLVSLVNTTGEAQEATIGLAGGRLNGKLLGTRPAAARRLVNNDRWHHFALVRDDEGDLLLFLDGALADQQGFPFARPKGKLITTERRMGVGFEGLLDEICFFNRALAATEIAALAGKVSGFVDRETPPLQLESDNAPTNPLLLKIVNTGALLDNVVFQGEDQMIAASSNFGVFVYSRSTPGQGKYLDGRGPVVACKSGQLLRPSRDGRSLEFFDVNKEVPTKKFFTNPPSPLRGETFFSVAPDEKELLVLCEKSISKVAFASGEVLATWPAHCIFAPVVWHPDGKCFAVNGKSSALVLSAADGQILLESPFGKEITDLAFSPDGKFLAICGDNPKGAGIILIDLASGKAAHSLGKPGQLVHRLAFTRDGRFLISGDQEGDVTFWNMGNQKSQPAMKGPGRIHALTVSPDGAHLAVSFPWELRLIDVGEVLQLEGPALARLKERPVVVAVPVAKLTANRTPLTDDELRQPTYDPLSIRIDLRAGKFVLDSAFTPEDPKDRSKSNPAVVFRIDVQAGQAVLVEMIPKEKDYTPQLILQDNLGTVLRHGGRGPGNTAKLVWLASKPGTFTVIATRLYGFDGRFTLTAKEVKRGDRLDDADLIDPPTPPRVTLKQAKTIGTYRAAAIAPDSKSAWVATFDNKLRHYSCPDFEVVATYDLPGPVQQLALDGRGMLYAAVELDKDKQPKDTSELADIHLYDTRALPAKEGMLKPAKVLPVAGKVRRLFVSPDDAWIYLLDTHHRKVARIDLAKAMIDTESALIDPETNALCMTPDGKSLFTLAGPKKLVQQLEPATLRIVKTIAINEPSMQRIQARDDGFVFLLPDRKNRNFHVCLLDSSQPIKAGEVVRLVRWGEYQFCDEIQLSPDQQHLFCGVFVSGRWIDARYVGARPDVTKGYNCGRSDFLGGKSILNGSMEVSRDGRFLFADRGVIVVVQRKD